MHICYKISTTRVVSANVWELRDVKIMIRELLHLLIRVLQNFSNLVKEYSLRVSGGGLVRNLFIYTFISTVAVKCQLCCCVISLLHHAPVKVTELMLFVILKVLY